MSASAAAAISVIGWEALTGTYQSSWWECHLRVAALVLTMGAVSLLLSAGMCVLFMCLIGFLTGGHLHAIKSPLAEFKLLQRS